MSDAAVHITRWGASGPRVVLIHGGAQGSASGGELAFAAQERLAGRGFQLIVPDRPGHGRSPSPGRPDDAAADGEWAADLLADGAHLVGHSFGGCVALDAASRRPTAVRSLTLIEPAMHKLVVRDPRVLRLLLRMMRANLFSASAATRAARVMEVLGIPPEIAAARSAEERERMGRALRRLVPPAKATLERQLAELKEQKVPLLVVTGGWSPAFEAVGDGVAALGGGERVVVRSEHHFPQLVSNEFNDVLAEFIGRRAAAA